MMPELSTVHIVLFHFFVSLSIYSILLLKNMMHVKSSFHKNPGVPQFKSDERHAYESKATDSDGILPMSIPSNEVFTSLDNNSINLTDIVRGQFCILFFHPECKPCNEELNSLVSKKLFTDSDRKIILIPQMPFSLSDYPKYSVFKDYIFTCSQNLKVSLNPSGRIPHGVIISKNGEVIYSGYTFTDEWRLRVDEL